MLRFKRNLVLSNMNYMSDIPDTEERNDSKRSRSRENKSATTFWMDNLLKKDAQDIARESKMTLTDLINRSVEIYIAHGAKLEDDEEIKMNLAAVNIARQKSTARSIAHDIQESNITLEKIDNIEESIKNIAARVKIVEDQIDNTVINDELRKIVQLEITTRVAPVLERLGVLMDTLDIGSR